MVLDEDGLLLQEVSTHKVYKSSSRTTQTLDVSAVWEHQAAKGVGRSSSPVFK